MKGPVTLKQAEDNWQTNMGVFVNGERAVYRGKDIFNELADINWFKLIMFGITGREFSDKQIKLFEAIQVITVSYPEPRLWNNRIAALSGSARSTGILGLSAATACSEAKIFGNQANIIAIDFIKRAKKTIEVGKDLSEFVISELKNKRAIGGYGRPLIDSLEMEANWNVTNKLSIYGNYAYQSSEDKDTNSDAADAPQQQLYLRAHYDISPMWSINSQLNHVRDRQRAASDLRPDISNYTTIDLTLRAKGLNPDIELALSARNLLDETVKEPSEAPGSIPDDLPLAGRAFFVELRKSFH